MGSISKNIVKPFRSSHGFHRDCFCGTRPAYHIPGTLYYYCRTHAMETRQRYSRWHQRGGHSRFLRAA